MFRNIFKKSYKIIFSSWNISADVLLFLFFVVTVQKGTRIGPQVTQSWRWLGIDIFRRRNPLPLSPSPREKVSFTVGAVTWVWRALHARRVETGPGLSRQMRGKRVLRSANCQPFSHGYRFLVMIKQVSLRREIVSFRYSRDRFFDSSPPVSFAGLNDS